MLRLPRLTKQDAVDIRQIQVRLQAAILRIEKTDDSDEQVELVNEVADLERRLSLAQSRHLLLGARAQGLDVKPTWLSTYSGLEWLTPEGRQSIENALRRRRTEDWIKLVPLIISVVAIMVSIASAVATSRFSQQKDFLLNRSWLSANDLMPPFQGVTTQKQLLPSEEFSLGVTNHGRAPALHAVAVGNASSANSDEIKLRSTIEKACSEASKASSSGDFVPPGSSLTILFRPIDDGKSPAPVAIAGCIGYDDSLDHERHVTSFGFRQASAKDGQVTGWVPYSLGYGIAY